MKKLYTSEFDEVMNVLRTTLKLHVRAGPQGFSQATITTKYAIRIIRSLPQLLSTSLQLGVPRPYERVVTNAHLRHL
jgi:hypothetical protein